MELQHIKTVMNLLPEAMILVQGDGSIVGANKAFQTQFRILPEQLVGQPLHGVVEDTPEDVREFLVSCSRTRDMTPGVLIMHGPDGTRVKCKVEGWVVQPRAGMEPALLLLRMQERTKGSDPFMTLNLRIERLENEIRERKLAQLELHEANRLKDELLATLAHELRNPLAPITTALELLSMVTDPEERASSLALATRQIQHMTRLVDDLLDISRFTLGKVTLLRAKLDLVKVVQDAVEGSAPLIRKRHQELHLNVPAHPVIVDGDPIRLTQVFLNLLNNASKFTQEKGRIDLGLHLEEGRVQVKVSDNGDGIDPEMLEKVFDMFTQDPTRTTAYSAGGLGIGLNIVKRLVEMHEGTVHGHSNGFGTGSTFTVELPLVSEVISTVPERSLLNAGPDTGSKRILVVDDNEDAAMTMALLLRKKGHVVQVVHDGVEAVGSVPIHLPEIIFMDIGMPRMNGFEACARIRELEAGQGVYIYAVSGWGQEEDRSRCMEAGFNDLMVKPVSKELLFEALHCGTALNGSEKE